MNYEELREELQKRGIDISVITLRRYVKNGLIPEPDRKHLGRGKGEQVDFSQKAIAEAAAAKIVFRKNRNPPMETVKKARDIAIETISMGSTLSLFEEQNLSLSDYEAKTLSYEWLQWYFLIKDGHNLSTEGHWSVDDNGFPRLIADGGKMREAFENSSKKWIKQMESLTDEEKLQLNEKANKQMEELKKRIKQKK